ncbi:MAG: response regulator [Phycisphaeraceae bacterium]|nr:MAG: response regulator [Phycisphaeraceae bacterium]
MGREKRTTTRKPATEAIETPRDGDARTCVDAGRVLIATADASEREILAGMLRRRSIQCDAVGTLTDAVGALSGAEYEAVVASLRLPDGSGVDLARRLQLEGKHTRTILCDSAPTLDDAVATMRAGAVDLIRTPFGEEEAAASVVGAIRSARSTREQSRRVDRLKRICRRLNTARQQVTSQVDVLCNDLVGAYAALAEQVSHVTLASEFGSILQQELDIESLLRTSLEYMLTKTGPTNAAVFLPSNHCDFSLGAYVNYDCPRDTADVLLDHLADVIAPRFQDETEIVQFENETELAEWIGEDANWLADSKVIVFSCRHEGECLAVITLFRDRSTPFSDELIPQLKVMSDLFARQLERIIRIHNRHHPDKEWSGWDSWDEDDEGDIIA